MIRHNLKNLKIILMGASSGIGKEVAINLLKLGCKIGIAARREANLIEIRNDFPNQVEYEIIDITSSDAIQKLEILINKIGGLDVYMHFSGIGKQNINLNIETEIDICKTNVIGFTTIIDYIYSYFRKNKIAGHILAVTSIAGTKGLGVAPAYSATKRFQNTYLESLKQLSTIDKSKITITDIRPGFVSTPLLNDENNYPLMMQPENVACKIISTLKKSKGVYTIDWRYKLIVSLWELIPHKIWIKLPIKTSKKRQKIT